MLATAGGTVVINDVEMTIDNHAIPHFEMGKNYLLIISLTPSRVAMLGAGPSGVFHVKEGDLLEGVDKADHPIKREINQRFNSKLSGLKHSVQP